MFTLLRVSTTALCFCPSRSSIMKTVGPKTASAWTLLILLTCCGFARCKMILTIDCLSVSEFADIHGCSVPFCGHWFDECPTSRQLKHYIADDRGRKPSGLPGLRIWNLGWLDSDKYLFWVPRIFSMIWVCHSCCPSIFLKFLVWNSIIWLNPDDILVWSAPKSAVVDTSWSYSLFVHLTFPFLCPRRRLDSAWLMAARAIALCVTALKLPGSSLRSVYLNSLSKRPPIKASLLAPCRPAKSRWAFAASITYEFALRTLGRFWFPIPEDFWVQYGHSLHYESRQFCC